MKKQIPLLALAALPLISSAQGLYNNGATITTTTGATLYVPGNFTNATGSTLTNGGTLTVKGNLVNNGTAGTAAASTLSLTGTTAQTLSGTSPVNAKDVVVNNAAGITVSTPLNVDGTMTFTSGILTATTAGSPVTFSANASVANTPTNASHINGFVRKTGTGAFTFPVGNATNYQPVGANLSANSAGLTARYYDADAGNAPYGTAGSSATPLLFVNHKEYWDLTPAGTATGTVTVYFDGYNNVGIGSTADLRVAHKTGGSWQNEGGTATGTTANGSVTSNSISTFSPFTLGSVSANSPLPLHLLAFEGTAAGSRNRLSWVTATEDAGTRFVMERSNAAGGFEALATVTGKGGSATYESYDDAPPSPVGYYRLKVLAGGAVDYSATVAIRRSSVQAGAVTVAPIPAIDKITVASTDVSLNGTTAHILDVQGREVYRFTLGAAQQINVADWPAGMYLLRLADGTALRISKL